MLFHLNRVYQIALFLVIVCCIYFRFYHIQEIGILHPDAFFYWESGREWMLGNEIVTEHFRPFIYWLYGKILWIGGDNDWSIKAFNGICDILTGITLIWSAWSLRKNLTLALSICASYLILWQPMAMSRTETVHTVSALFITLTVACLIKWTEKLNKLFIFLSGLFLSFAWLTHPDLAVLGLAVFFTILYKIFSGFETSRRETFKTFMVNFIIFLVGYFIVLFLFIERLGLDVIIQSLLANHKAQTKSMTGSVLWRFIYFSYHYLRINLGGLAGLGLYIFSIGLFLINAIKHKISSKDFVVFIFPVVYLILCSLLFARILIPRLLLPLIPLIIFFIHLQFHEFFKRKLITPILLSGFIIVLNLKSFSLAKTQEISPYRQIHNRYEKFISASDKMLITPLTIQSIHSPLMKKIYLHGNGEYLIFSEEESLDQVISERNITYVWISHILRDERVFGKNIKPKNVERLRTLYKMEPKDYNSEKERILLREYLKSKNATLVDQSNLGELYELK